MRDGGVVFPGLVDAHAHLMGLAKGRLELRVAHHASEEDAAAAVARAAAAVTSGEWLVGRGWDQMLWPARQFPSRASLDRAAPAHPVALTRIDGPAIWANTAALRAAWIDRHTGDPAGGLVAKDAGGEPTGLLVDPAQELMRMQQTHCTSDLRWAGERLGAERLPGACAWRSLLETGTIIAGGADFPVEDANPFHGLHAAVTRRPLDDAHPGWQPEQRMTGLEALRSFTSWNAWAADPEADTGSLEAGKRADLVVLSDDVMTCDEARIKAIAPVLTMVGGEVVFRSDVIERSS